MNQLSHFVQSLPSNAPKTARGQKTWIAILQAAEHEFGEKGYHEAAITSITQKAGVAMGTFYVHFKSKEEIFRALVSHMGQLTRSWIAERVADAPDRLEAEKRGIGAFIEFARTHKNLYRIVNEAQFVAPDAYRTYFDSFADAYERQLDDAAAKGEVRPGKNNHRAWALIGASVFLGQRFGVWDEEYPIDDIADSIGDLIFYGLTPDNKP
jgi:AcrR family transcriptional regulator